MVDRCPLTASDWLLYSPGILRLRPHVLPTEAIEDACLFLVILSLILPSPVTFTVNGLPGGHKHIYSEKIYIQISFYFKMSNVL